MTFHLYIIYYWILETETLIFSSFSFSFFKHHSSHPCLFCYLPLVKLMTCMHLYLLCKYFTNADKSCDIVTFMHHYDKVPSFPASLSDIMQLGFKR